VGYGATHSHVTRAARPLEHLLSMPHVVQRTEGTLYEGVRVRRLTRPA